MLSENPSDVSPFQVTAVRSFLESCNKADASEQEVLAVARAVSEGSAKTAEALMAIGITFQPGNIQEFEERLFPQLAAAFPRVQEAVRLGVAQVLDTPLAPAKTRERIAGPGFPMGGLTIEPDVQESEVEVKALLEKLDIDSIYNTCVNILGMEPKRHIMNVRVFHAPEQGSQAHMSFQRDYRTRLYPEHRRVRMEVTGVEPNHQLAINYNFFSKDPEEGRGVLYHEFGHHWSQKLQAACQGNMAFMEGIAELTRVVAARREGAPWKQVYTRAPQILNGQECPSVAAANYVDCDARLSNVAKRVATHRLVANLDGIDERKLAGIARACTYATVDRTSVPMRQLLDDIERETGVVGFAERCIRDQVLTPGNLKPGEMAMAFMNDVGNQYSIMRFHVPNDGSHFGWSVREHLALPDNLQAEDFHMYPIETTPLPFGVYFQKPDGQIAFGITTGGSFRVTTEFILKYARQGRISWQAGETRVYYGTPGSPRVLLEHPLRITQEDIAQFEKA
jgi:hypothetical protein